MAEIAWVLVRELFGPFARFLLALCVLGLVAEGVLHLLRRYDARQTATEAPRDGR